MAATEASSQPMVMLSSDGKEFKTDRKVVEMFKVVKDMLETLTGDDPNTPIPANNVRGVILEKIIEWAEHHKDDPDTSDEEEQYKDRRTDDIPKWDQEFLEKMTKEQIYETLQACNYLDLKPLLEICCKTICNWMKGKSVEEVRTMFGIESDYTPEEEEKMKKDNAWAEDLTN